MVPFVVGLRLHLLTRLPLLVAGYLVNLSLLLTHWSSCVHSYDGGGGARSWSPWLPVSYGRQCRCFMTVRGRSIALCSHGCSVAGTALFSFPVPVATTLLLQVS